MHVRVFTHMFAYSYRCIYIYISSCHIVSSHFHPPPVSLSISLTYIHTLSLSHTHTRTHSLPPLSPSSLLRINEHRRSVLVILLHVKLLTHTRCLSLSFSFSLPRALALVFLRACSLSHKYTHSLIQLLSPFPSLSFPLSLPLSLPCSLSRSLCHTHTHTHLPSLSLCFSFTHIHIAIVHFFVGAGCH